MTAAWARKPPAALAAPLPPHLDPATRAPRASDLLDTTVRPLLQMGPFGVRHETGMVMPAVFRTANALATAPGGGRTTLHWTSGYFSIQEQYREAVLACEAQVRIVIASPEVSGAPALRSGRSREHGRSEGLTGRVAWWDDFRRRRTGFSTRKGRPSTSRPRTRTSPSGSTTRPRSAHGPATTRTSSCVNGPGPAGPTTPRASGSARRSRPRRTSASRSRAGP